MACSDLLEAVELDFCPSFIIIPAIFFVGKKVWICPSVCACMFVIDTYSLFVCWGYSSKSEPYIWDKYVAVHAHN